MQHPSGIGLVVSGPSGVGKSSICRRLLADEAGLHFSVSCTTRQPRPGEVEGQDYYFLDDDAFAAHLAAGDFLEHAEVHGHRYGTLRSELEKHLPAGRDLLLDIDVQGAEQVRHGAAARPWLPCLAFVFVGPPTVATLEERLRGRGTETPEVLARRLAAARAELEQWRLYDYLIVNDSLPASTEALSAILAATRRRSACWSTTPPWA